MLVNEPEDIVDLLKDMEDIYLIKVKCIACSESVFFPYVIPQIEGEALVIGERSFPIRMVEKITIRKNVEELRIEEQYKVSNSYLKSFLDDESREVLKKFDLL